MYKKLYIDLETTGLSNYTNAIIQISCIMEHEEKSISTIDLNIRPFEDAVLDKKALQINGLTEEELKSPGRLSYSEAFEKLEDFLSYGVDRYDKNDKFHMIGYNVSGFDMRFLRTFFVKNKSKFFNSWFWFPPIDVMLIAAYVLAEERPSLPNFKLKTVVDYLGISLENINLHEAMADITVTKEILSILEEKYIKKI